MIVGMCATHCTHSHGTDRHWNMHGYGYIMSNSGLNSSHRTKFHQAVTFAALVLLQRLKAHFPTARGSSGHQLFILAFMIASSTTSSPTSSKLSGFDVWRSIVEITIRSLRQWWSWRKRQGFWKPLARSSMNSKTRWRKMGFVENSISTLPIPDSNRDVTSSGVPMYVY